ncbi:uncharacterized protein LOC126569410 [Anopheles aquasalis]|uniref:uncharacterized protein LOC126569410 n=1 Tax=Anopheles aquasalis TaxID=42839 RepID=UPI00215A428E|nr:uncharacterized protein LOC126569410 [Anopheles aquasalis]
MERARVCRYLCGLVLWCLIGSISAQLDESFASSTEPVIAVYDEDPNNNAIPIGEGDTLDPEMVPDDNSTLLEPSSTNNLTADGNATEHEHPFDPTTPLNDANYDEYYNNLEKLLNKSGDFNYHYPDFYDYNFNRSTSFNQSTPSINLSTAPGFFQVAPGDIGPSLYMPPGVADLQRAYSPPYVPGGIMTTSLKTNFSTPFANSNASSRAWPADTASYSGFHSDPKLRSRLHPVELDPYIKPPTTKTTRTTARKTTTVRSTRKTKTKRGKSVTTRSSRKTKPTRPTVTKPAKQFRSMSKSRITSRRSTTTTTQPPNVRRSLRKPTSSVRRDRRYLGSRNRTTPNGIRRRRTRTVKRFRKLDPPTPPARRRRIPLARPRQRQRPWAMPPLMLDYEFWMF